MEVVVYYAAPYLLVPIGAYIGTLVGVKIIASVFSRVVNYISDTLCGNVTVTVKQQNTYIISNGNVILLDPDKVHTVIDGQLSSCSP